MEFFTPTLVDTCFFWKYFPFEHSFTFKSMHWTTHKHEEVNMKKMIDYLNITIFGNHYGLANKKINHFLLLAFVEGTESWTYPWVQIEFHTTWLLLILSSKK